MCGYSEVFPIEQSRRVQPLSIGLPSLKVLVPFFNEFSSEFSLSPFFLSLGPVVQRLMANINSAMPCENFEGVYSSLALSFIVS